MQLNITNKTASKWSHRKNMSFIENNIIFYGFLSQPNSVSFKQALDLHHRKYIKDLLKENNLEITEENIKFLQSTIDEDVAIHILKSTQDS